MQTTMGSNVVPVSPNANNTVSNQNDITSSTQANTNPANTNPNQNWDNRSQDYSKDINTPTNSSTMVPLVSTGEGNNTKNTTQPTNTPTQQNTNQNQSSANQQKPVITKDYGKNDFGYGITLDQRTKRNNDIAKQLSDNQYKWNDKEVMDHIRSLSPGVSDKDILGTVGNIKTKFQGFINESKLLQVASKYTTGKDLYNDFKAGKIDKKTMDNIGTVNPELKTDYDKYVKGQMDLKIVNAGNKDNLDNENKTDTTTPDLKTNFDSKAFLKTLGFDSNSLDSNKNKTIVPNLVQAHKDYTNSDEYKGLNKTYSDAKQKRQQIQLNMSQLRQRIIGDNPGATRGFIDAMTNKKLGEMNGDYQSAVLDEENSSTQLQNSINNFNQEQTQTLQQFQMEQQVKAQDMQELQTKMQAVGMAYNIFSGERNYGLEVQKMNTSNTQWSASNLLQRQTLIASISEFQKNYDLQTKDYQEKINEFKKNQAMLTEQFNKKMAFDIKNADTSSKQFKESQAQALKIHNEDLTQNQKQFMTSNANQIAQINLQKQQLDQAIKAQKDANALGYANLLKDNYEFKMDGDGNKYKFDKSTGEIIQVDDSAINYSTQGTSSGFQNNNPFGTTKDNKPITYSNIIDGMKDGIDMVSNSQKTNINVSDFLKDVATKNGVKNPTEYINNILKSTGIKGNMNLKDVDGDTLAGTMIRQNDPALFNKMVSDGIITKNPTIDYDEQQKQQMNLLKGVNLKPPMQSVMPIANLPTPTKDGYKLNVDFKSPLDTKDADLDKDALEIFLGHSKNNYTGKDKNKINSKVNDLTNQYITNNKSESKSIYDITEKIVGSVGSQKSDNYQQLTREALMKNDVNAMYDNLYSVLGASKFDQANNGYSFFGQTMSNLNMSNDLLNDIENSGYQGGSLSADFKNDIHTLLGSQTLDEAKINTKIFFHTTNYLYSASGKNVTDQEFQNFKKALGAYKDNPEAFIQKLEDFKTMEKINLRTRLVQMVGADHSSLIDDLITRKFNIKDTGSNQGRVKQSKSNMNLKENSIGTNNMSTGGSTGFGNVNLNNLLDPNK